MKSNTRLSPHVKCADSLRSIDFMCRDRHHVNVEFVHIHLYFAHTLGCIGVEEHFIGSAYPTNLFNRLDGSDLIVNVND